MAKSQSQKQKLLYVRQILLKYTDDKNGLTVNEIIDILASYGINAERRSIYDDIRTLESFGMDICTRKSNNVTYFVGNRDFEMPELKLLIDAVQSSKFITAKKSMELIKKVEGLASIHEGKQLQRQVFVTNRVKTLNEKIYYTVDSIHSAISRNKAISFYYFEWVISFGDKEKINKKLRQDGKPYVVYPLSLIWDDENYYLVAYNINSRSIRHYRVDKIDEVTEKENIKIDYDKIKDFNCAVYSKSVFGMFSGEKTRVKLKADNKLIGVFVDRFGKDIFITKSDERSFFVEIQITQSPQFYGWLCGLGNKVQIISPQKSKEDFKMYIKSIYNLYK